MCLAGKDIARLVGEDDMLVVYHCMSNDREKHASAPSGADDEVISLYILRGISSVHFECEGSQSAFDAYNTLPLTKTSPQASIGMPRSALPATSNSPGVVWADGMTCVMHRHILAGWSLTWTQQVHWNPC